MLTNYILTAWRNLIKNKMVSAINILGLTLGLASAILAILYAKHELTYETCHEKYNDIHKIYIQGNFGEMQNIPASFGPEGKELMNMFPEVDKYSISRETGGTVRVGENIFNENRITVADSSFFQFFTIPLIQGGPKKNSLSVVISEKIAQRYFGDSNPIDQYMNMNIWGVHKDFIVTGVYKDFPSNTIIQPEFIIPFDFSNYISQWDHESYQSSNYNNYLLLNKGADYKKLNEKIASQFKIPVDVENTIAYLMPIKEIHFSGTYENNKGKLIGFLISGLFMLFTSCANYINLTNILFSVRGKETGIRKVNGGKRIDIFLQFLIDTALSLVISFNLAIILLKSVLPDFNVLMDTNIIIDFNLETIALGLSLFLFTVLFSGLYPAIKYSALKAISLIQARNGKPRGKNRSLVFLTSFQFFLAIIFIQFMMIMSKQNEFMNDINIKKFDGENVLCVEGWSWGDLYKVKDELLKNPSIKHVSWGNTIPSYGMNMTSDWKNEENNTMAAIYRCEEDYLKVYDIKLTRGRFFDILYPSDKENSIVINEKMVDELEFEDPINELLIVQGKQYSIIGVIENYMALPPIFNHMPSIIQLSDIRNQFLIIKIRPEEPEKTQHFIKETLKKINAEQPIELKYHDDVLYETKEAKSYVSAAQLMDLFFRLTIITSLIGIFGLSVFIAKRHRKEIGIRKVCGASVPNLMFKLLKGLIIQVLVIIAIATPLVYFGSQGYLTVFPFRIEPGILYYLSGGVLALLMLLFTVSWQTWRAANSNPIESLRYE